MQEKLSSVANLGCSEGIDKKQNLDKAFSALGTLSGSRFCRYNRKFRIPPRLHTTPLACPFVWHFDKLLPHSFDALKRRMGFTSGNGRWSFEYGFRLGFIRPWWPEFVKGAGLMSLRSAAGGRGRGRILGI